MNEAADNRERAKLRKVLLDVSPPRAAHLILWTRAGEQILLEVGYFDLASIHAQNQPAHAGEKILDWFVTDRFILDFEAAKRIVDSIGELGIELKNMAKEGTGGGTKGTT